MTRPVLTSLLALAQTMEGFNTAAFMKDASKAEEAQKTMNVAFQKIDKLTKANIMTSNTAARRKAKLARARASALEAVSE